MIWSSLHRLGRGFFSSKCTVQVWGSSNFLCSWYQGKVARAWSRPPWDAKHNEPLYLCFSFVPAWCGHREFTFVYIFGQCSKISVYISLHIMYSYEIWNFLKIQFLVDIISCSNENWSAPLSIENDKILLCLGFWDVEWCVLVLATFCGQCLGPLSKRWTCYPELSLAKFIMSPSV